MPGEGKEIAARRAWHGHDQDVLLASDLVAVLSAISGMGAAGVVRDLVKRTRIKHHRRILRSYELL